MSSKIISKRGSYASLHGSIRNILFIKDLVYIFIANITETKPKQNQQKPVKTHQRYFSCKFVSPSSAPDSRRQSMNINKGSTSKKI